jgi:intracellular septation protein
MKFLFDFFPLLLFFAAYKLGGMHQDAAHAMVQHYLSGFIAGGSSEPSQAPLIWATLVGILATALQVGYLLVRGKKVPGMSWVSLGVFVVFGGAGIYFHDENFIKWKPTIIYWLLAGGMLVAHLLFKKNLIRKTMEEQIQLPDQIWHKLLYAWIAFFIGIGVLNLLVAFVLYKGDTSAWVSFKAFGTTAIFFVFIVVQTLFLSKHIKEEA